LRQEFRHRWTGGVNDAAAPTTTTTTTTTFVPPVTAPANLSQLSGSVPYQDRDGYQFRIGVDVTFNAFGSSITNAAPGMTQLDVATSGTISVTNVTPGRNADAFRPGFTVVALYASNRPMCTLVFGNDIGSKYSGPVKGVKGLPDNAFCGNRVGEGLVVGGTLASGQAASGELVRVVSTGESRGKFTVKEPDVDALAGDINNGPDGWIVLQTETFNNPGGDPSDTACFYEGQLLYGVELPGASLTAPSC
jgi:hypothetical protein